MSNFESFNADEVIRYGIFDPNIKGLYEDSEGNLMFDRRLSVEAMQRRGLSPRIADINIIGPAILPVPTYLAEELMLDRFFKPKQ